MGKSCECHSAAIGALSGPYSNNYHCTFYQDIGTTRIKTTRLKCLSSKFLLFFSLIDIQLLDINF